LDSNKASALLRFQAQARKLFGWNTIAIHSRYLKYDRKPSDKPSGSARKRAIFTRYAGLDISGKTPIFRLNIWRPHRRVLRGRLSNSTAL